LINNIDASIKNLEVQVGQFAKKMVTIRVNHSLQTFKSIPKSSVRQLLPEVGKKLGWEKKKLMVMRIRWI